MKNLKTAYLLWALSLLCICGMNRFYTGRVGTGLIFLFTFGLFGFGAIYDLFVMDTLVDTANRKKAMEQQFDANLQDQPRPANPAEQNITVNVTMPADGK